jgi:hypothetical protein
MSFARPSSNLAKEWPQHLIEDKLSETRTVCVADFNGDGRPDLLGTASGAALVAWYENVGKPGSPPSWKKHVIDDKSPAPIHGHPVDMDGDGDVDVVMALGMREALVSKEKHQVVWYENVGKPGKGVEWKKHVVGNLPFAFEAIAADVDGDGKAFLGWNRAVVLAFLDEAGWPFPVKEVPSEVVLKKADR